MNLILKPFGELTVKELYEILKSREEIFTLGQNIRVSDIDDIDYESLHCFFIDGNRVVAYLRAYDSEGSRVVVNIGRVLTLEHGMGVGTDLMRQSIKAIKARWRCRKIVLHSQKQAVGFYERLGFVIVSDEFLEAGIPHLTMELMLEDEEINL